MWPKPRCASANEKVSSLKSERERLVRRSTNASAVSAVSAQTRTRRDSRAVPRGLAGAAASPPPNGCACPSMARLAPQEECQSEDAQANGPPWTLDGDAPRKRLHDRRFG